MAIWKFTHHFFRICLAIFILLANRASAEDFQLVLNDSNNTYELPKIEFLQSETNIGINEILTSTGFQEKEWPFEFGFVNKAAWLKFKLQNNSQTRTWFVRFFYPTLYKLDFFIVKNGNVIGRKSGGIGMEFYKGRDVDVSQLYFKFIFPKDELLDIYIRAETHGGASLSFDISSSGNAIMQQSWQMAFHGFVFGAIIIVLISNISLLWALRRKIYLVYVCHMFNLIFFLLSYTKISYLFWPNSVKWNELSLLVAISVMLTTVIGFSKEFLAIKSRWPKFYIGCNVAIAAFVFVILPACFIIPYTIMIQILMPSIMFIGFVCSVTGIYSLRAGHQAAKLYNVGFMVFFLGGIALALSRYGVGIPTVIAANAVEIGIMIKAIFCSLAIAEQLKTERARARQAEQQLKIEAERERAEGALKLFGTVLSIADKFNSPLMAIENYLECIRRKRVEFETARVQNENDIDYEKFSKQLDLYINGMRASCEHLDELSKTLGVYRESNVTVDFVDLKKLKS